MNLHEELNPEQLEAVETRQGPILVIAGAGSGKTRTLVYRVARLISDGVPPDQILLLTFTRRAASTMLGRAAELVGDACRQVVGGTFHAFAYARLRRHAARLGHPPNFTVLDRADIQNLLSLLAKEMDLVGQGKRFPQKATLASLVSRTENTGRPIARILESEAPHLLSESENLDRLFTAYRAYKTAHGLMDYDDLLVKWRQALERDPELRAAMGRQFQYIMVDEYQDTNLTQAQIVRLLATGHDNVMAVGDDAQSIYSFRGANFKNILDFPQLFPGTKIIKLERNYRSTQPNLDCTNAIIANAAEKFTKKLIAQRPGGAPPVLFVARDEEDQAAFVVREIQKLQAKGIPASEIGVLFRASFHSFRLETELNRLGIAFVKRGGLRLLESAHTKDLLCMLRLLVNPRDRLSWNRVLSLIEGLGPKGIEKLFVHMLQNEDPLLALQTYKTKAGWRQAVIGLAQLLTELREAPGSLLEVLVQLQAWYQPHLERLHAEDHPKRLQELDQLKAIAARYEDAVSLLAELALDPPEEEDTAQNGQRIVLSTIHSAKGLEWTSVFVLSLAEGRFPAPMAVHRKDETEEERRLFYVAATRAKDSLYLCYPAFITVAGSGILPARPSRFLEEIPSSLLQPAQNGQGPEARKDDHAMPGPSRPELDASHGASIGSGSSGAFAPGARVRHPIFGPGRVLRHVDHEKVQVLFDVGGEKTLHLGYAKLSLV